MTAHHYPYADIMVPTERNRSAYPSSQNPGTSPPQHLPRIGSLVQGPESGGSRRGPSPSSTFPAKLHLILSNSDLSNIITWMPHGRSWRVLQPKLFSENVMPKYFTHQSKYSSFTRQVNGWGFKRITHGPDRNSYYHELFLRDFPHKARRMTRRSSSGGTKSATKSSTPSDEAEPNFYEMSGIPYPSPGTGPLCGSGPYPPPPVSQNGHNYSSYHYPPAAPPHHHPFQPHHYHPPYHQDPMSAPPPVVNGFSHSYGMTSSQHQAIGGPTSFEGTGQYPSYYPPSNDHFPPCNSGSEWQGGTSGRTNYPYAPYPHAPYPHDVSSSFSQGPSTEENPPEDRNSTSLHDQSLQWPTYQSSYQYHGDDGVEHGLQPLSSILGEPEAKDKYSSPQRYHSSDIDKQGKPFSITTELDDQYCTNPFDRDNSPIFS